MLHRLVMFSLLVAASTLSAKESAKNALADFAWEKRQLLVFSPSEDHPYFRQFNQLSSSLDAGITDRRLQIWRILPQQSITLDNQVQQGLSSQQFYDHFKIGESDFTVLLIGYDQGQKLRQEVVDLEEIFAEIDRMPMRQNELKR